MKCLGLIVPVLGNPLTIAGVIIVPSQGMQCCWGGRHWEQEPALFPFSCCDKHRDQNSLGEEKI